MTITTIRVLINQLNTDIVVVARILVLSSHLPSCALPPLPSLSTLPSLPFLPPLSPSLTPSPSTNLHLAFCHRGRNPRQSILSCSNPYPHPSISRKTQLAFRTSLSSPLSHPPSDRLKDIVLNSFKILAIIGTASRTVTKTLQATNNKNCHSSVLLQFKLDGRHTRLHPADSPEYLVSQSKMPHAHNPLMQLPLSTRFIQSFGHVALAKDKNRNRLRRRVDAKTGCKGNDHKMQPTTFSLFPLWQLRASAMAIPVLDDTHPLPA